MKTFGICLFLLLFVLAGCGETTAEPKYQPKDVVQWFDGNIWVCGEVVSVSKPLGGEWFYTIKTYRNATTIYKRQGELTFVNHGENIRPKFQPGDFVLILEKNNTQGIVFWSTNSTGEYIYRVVYLCPDKGIWVLESFRQHELELYEEI